MKLKFITIAFLLQSLMAFACLDARQHKLFPIGVIDENIVFIEAHIKRTHDTDKSENDTFEIKEKWHIKSYVAVYDKAQRLISKTEIDTDDIKGKSYLSLLQSNYSNGLFQIKSLFKNIDYFTNDYISFCDYQKKCNKLELKSDTIAKKDHFIYNKKNYSVRLNRSQKEKERALFIDNLLAYFISSVRIYKTKDLELVIGHLATGHEVSMGWITDNPEKKETENGDTIKPRKEYRPDFKFNELYTAVYQEPLMHHGSGYDFFIVTKN
tara:strand:+ start:3530 stop:4330 length:801 start_codon:yes stop_codon:yes gene_type:complete